MLNSVKISLDTASIGQVVQGIRIGGEFLAGEKDDIIAMLEQQYENIVQNNDRKAKVIGAINNVIGQVSQKQFKEAYQTMAQVEGALFNITETVDTSLLTMLNSAENGQQQFYYYPDEADAIVNKDQYGHSAGITSGIGVAKNNIFSLSVQDQVNEHWANMLSTVNTQKPPGSKQTYRKQVYGRRREAQATGQILDAYINHLAMHHPQVLTSITSQKLLDIQLKRSVLQEAGPDNFLDLLQQSTNRTKWTSGGDVIIVNRSGDIVVNIQIKSSLSKKQIVGHLSTKALVKALEKIKNAVSSIGDTNKYEYAKKVYDLYSTSAVVQDGLQPMVKKEIQSLLNQIKI